MHISWHGQYTVKIQYEKGTLVLDPYSSVTGLPAFRSKAEIVVLSNPSDPNMSHVAAIQGEPLVINNPGEYSLDGMTLLARGWFSDDNQERSIQLWNIEGVTLLHIAALNRDLTDNELQALEKTNIDVLLLPVGGGSGLDTKQALHLVTTVEPRIVIPIHFALPGLTEELVDVSQFAKEMGVEPKQQVPKLIVKAGRLPQEDMTTVILSV